MKPGHLPKLAVEKTAHADALVGENLDTLKLVLQTSNRASSKRLDLAELMAHRIVVSCRASAKTGGRLLNALSSDQPVLANQP